MENQLLLFSLDHHLKKLLPATINTGQMFRIFGGLDRWIRGAFVSVSSFILLVEHKVERTHSETHKRRGRKFGGIYYFEKCRSCTVGFRAGLSGVAFVKASIRVLLTTFPVSRTYSFVCMLIFTSTLGLTSTSTYCKLTFSFSEHTPPFEMRTS